MKKDKRVVYLDMARIITMLSVVIAHVASMGWYAFDIYSGEWAEYNLYYGLNRWGVAVFLMISGALFLNREKEITVKDLFGKYIKRLVVAYLFWATIYACKDAFVAGTFSMNEFLKTIVNGHYHMWYIPMIIGIYLVLPILRELIKNDKVMRYLMTLLLFFCFVLTTIGLIPQLHEVYSIFDRMLFSAFGGYTAYFLLGYYLNKTELRKLVRYVCYLFGVLGCASTILITMLGSRKKGMMYIDFNDGFSINVFCICIAVFVFIKYAYKGRNMNDYLKNIVIKLSECMFGVYLVHPFVLEILELLGISVLQFNPRWAVPAVSISTYLISVLLVLGIKKVPFLKKYIV